MLAEISGAFDVVKVLHILSAIVGFGAVMLNGLYAAQARTLRPAEGLAVMEVNFWISTKVAEWFILATGVFGFGLLGLSKETLKFTQTWVWLSLVIYVAALGLSHAVLRPRVKQIIVLQREVVAAGLPKSGPPPQAEQMAALGQQVGAIAGVLQIALVVILYLMVAKPGL